MPSVKLTIPDSMANLPMGNDDENWIPSKRYALGKEDTSVRAGQGRIFLALDRRFNRPVLIKKLKVKTATLTSNQLRFVREAEINARLQHPGIVPVYGLGHRSDGTPYFAMQFIDGKTLQAAIDTFHGAKCLIGEKIKQDLIRSGKF